MLFVHPVLSICGLAWGRECGGSSGGEKRIGKDQRGRKHVALDRKSERSPRGIRSEGLSSLGKERFQNDCVYFVILRLF